MKCGNCKFWDVLEMWSGDPQGECHRFPPHFFPLMARDYKECLSNGAWILPVTSDDDWCGEFKAKDNQVK